MNVSWRRLGRTSGAARTPLRGAVGVEGNLYKFRVCAAPNADIRNGAKRKTGEGGIRTPGTV